LFNGTREQELRTEEGVVKRLFAVVLFASVFALGIGEAKSQALTQAERDLVAKKLEASHKDLLEATKGLSAAQWDFKPSIFRWSVAECLEHIALSEDLIFNFTQQAMKTPAKPPKDPAGVAQADSALIKNVGDRSSRFTAPEPLRPKHRSSPQEMLSALAASRARTIEFAKNPPDDIRNHCANGPGGNCMDGYQWLLLIATHTERHLAQLLEVKADPKFPKQ
jgi:hypothetical protein